MTNMRPPMTVSPSAIMPNHKPPSLGPWQEEIGTIEANAILNGYFASSLTMLLELEYLRFQARFFFHHRRSHRMTYRCIAFTLNEPND